MKKRIISLLLVMVMLVGLMPVVAMEAGAVETLSAAPYAKIEYGYSDEVEVGTIRYIRQNVGDKYYYYDYWKEWQDKRIPKVYYGPGSECGTSCISMALSYIGVNKTPKDILDYGKGHTTWGNEGQYTPAVWTGMYSNITQELENAYLRYVEGNGKYSPPVIHLNIGQSYDGSEDHGHFVVIAGRVDDNTWQVVDPATSAITNYDINGSSVTYFGVSNKIDQIHQWYNPNAEIVRHVEETYPCYGILKVTADEAYVRSMPCSKATDPDSENVEGEVVGKGKKYTATELVLNDQGNYWYKVTTAEGKTGYIYAGNVSFTQNNITLTEQTSPGEHAAGTGFPVRGIVSSPNQEIIEIKVWVERKSDGVKVLEHPQVQLGDRTDRYDLSSPEVNQNLKFGTLPVGEYRYRISATARSSYSPDGKERYTSDRSELLYDEVFTVVEKEACTHTYQAVVTPPTTTSAGFTTYTCTKCGYSYIGDHVDALPDAQKIDFNLNGGVLDGYTNEIFVDKFNAERGAGEVILYTTSGEIVDTNYWGMEIAVDANGRVVAKRGYNEEAQLTIPANGFVLSMHFGGDYQDAVTFYDETDIGDYVGYTTVNGVTYAYAYDTRDGYLANHKYVCSGSTYGDLPVPTKEGYSFAGWYAQPYAGWDPITSDNVFDGVTTLHALWANEVYTGHHVRFEPNGGTLGTYKDQLTVTAFNAWRDVDYVIIHNCGGVRVDSNYWGIELAVDADGKVIGKRGYNVSDQLTVPEGGFVVSLHLPDAHFYDTTEMGEYVGYTTVNGVTTVYAYATYTDYLAHHKHMEVGERVGALPVPVREGYIFEGWFTYDGYLITENSFGVSDSVLYAKWRAISTHEHQYSSVVVEPGCTEQGYTVHTCSCGDSYIDSYVDATGHHHEVVETREPTPTEEGYKVWRCPDCGDEYVETIPATGEVILWGDANGDGVVNPVDATMILRYFVGDTEVIGIVDVIAADVNGDGYITSVDATLVLRYFVGDLAQFPVE